MRSVSMVVCCVAAAAVASPVVSEIDSTRVVTMSEQPAAASQELSRWFEAIARAEPKAVRADDRQVVAFDKGLYGFSYLGYQAVVACRGAAEDCDAKEAEMRAAIAAFITKNRGGPQWASYEKLFENMRARLDALVSGARRHGQHQAAWRAEVVAFGATVDARDTALAAAADASADVATLEAAVAAVRASDAACAALLKGRTRETLPAECPANAGPFEARREIALLKNRLPAKSPAGRCHACADDRAVAWLDIDPSAFAAGPQVTALFEAVHPSRLRFLARDSIVDGRVVARRGEVVLWLKAIGGEFAVTLDNRRVAVPYEALSATPIKGAAWLASKPEAWVLLGEDTSGRVIDLTARVPVAVDGSPPPRELPGFVSAMDPGAKDVAALVQSADAFEACFAKSMKRLDPSGTAWRFTRETYNVRTGATVRVENYETALMRQSCKACNCQKQNAARVALAGKVLAPQKKAQAAAYASLISGLQKKLAN